MTARPLPLILGLSAALLAVDGCATLPTRGDGPGKGEAAPEFVLRDAEGHPHELASLLEKGKPTVLVFYQGHWSKGARQHLEAWARAHDELHDRGVQLVAISADDPSQAATLRDDLGLPFTLLSDEDLLVSTAFGVAMRGEDLAVPATMVILPDRTIHWRHVGERRWDLAPPRKVLRAVDRALDDA